MESDDNGQRAWNESQRKPSETSPKPADGVSTVSGRRLVFMVGVPRSGTTWLQLMLSSSDRVVSVNETHLFNGYMRSLFAEWEFRKHDARPIGLHEFIGEDEYLAIVRNFACSVMMKILVRKPTATVILEKTPRHVKCWNDILKVFPDAYFLHLVRDPRSVVSSLLAANRKWGQAWGSVDEMEWCDRWIEDVSSARELEKATPRYMQVRYEDLKGMGIEIVRSVFSWLGVDVEREECSRILRDHSIDNLKENRVEGTAWDLGAEPQEFFRLGECDSWKRDLSPRQSCLVEHCCKKLMLEFGYVPVCRRKVVFPMVAKSYIRRALRAGLRRLVE